MAYLAAILIMPETWGGPSVCHHELQFAIGMNWAQAILNHAAGPEDLRALHDGLRRGADSAEGLQIPPCVLTAFGSLPESVNEAVVPNYVSQARARRFKRPRLIDRSSTGILRS
jgi:hypothetical protein